MAPASTWTQTVGVIELPDGVRLRGRGLRKPLPNGEQPDFRLPRDRAAAAGAIADAYVRRHYDKHAVETPGQKRYVRNFLRL